MTEAGIQNQNQRGRASIIGLILACLGIAYATWLLLDYAQFLAKARETPGEIVARNSSDFTIQYQVDGQTFQIEEKLPSTKGMSGLRRMGLQPGVEVTVLYDPGAPQKAKWKSDRLWVFPAAFLFVCVLAALAALYPNAMRRPLRS